VINKIIFFSLVFIKILSAQVPGKISGYVKDGSGSPLIGVNILLQNYSIGASTDVEGNFIILNVSPGKYTVVVSSIGYQTIKENNVTIKPGLTTTLDFVLHENSVELGEEVIVTAKSKLIQKDETGKTITISSDELEKLPTVNLQEVLSTQSNINVLTNSPNAKSGYNEQGIDDIRMRGGRNNEVALLIDGVKVSNPVYGGFGTQISVNAIKQIDIESGGYSAKYGNALSGVINLTTKDGVEKTNGSIRYYSSNPFDVDFLTNGKGKELRLQNLQATLQGRAPFLNEVSFFISGEVNANSGTPLLFDDIIWDEHRIIQIDTNGDGILDPFTLPSSQEIIDGYLRYGNLDSIQPGLASNWKKVLGPDGRKINPVDMYKGWKGLGWENYYNFFGKLNFNLSTDVRVLFSFLLDKSYRQFNNFNAYYDYNMQCQNIKIL
jgi:outer membrane receptor protein involved in Fe transport